MITLMLTRGQKLFPALVAFALATLTLVIFFQDHRSSNPEPAPGHVFSIDQHEHVQILGPVRSEGAKPRLGGPAQAQPQASPKGIGGRLVDANGSPLEGAEVRVAAIAWGLDGDLAELARRGRLRSRVASSISDPLGSFVLVCPLPGQLLLEVAAAGFSPLRKALYISAFELPYDIGRLTVIRGATVSGYVLDSHGVPIPGAVIIQEPPPRDDMGKAILRGDEIVGHANDEGMFELTSVTRMNHTFRAEAKGYLPCRQAIFLEGAADTIDASFILEEGLYISGIVGCNWSPVTELVVRPNLTDGQRARRVVPDWALSTPVDDEGRFHLGPFPIKAQSEEFEVAVRHVDGWPEGLSASASARPGDSNVMLKVEAPFYCSFVPLDEDGCPIEGLSAEQEFLLAGRRMGSSPAAIERAQGTSVCRIRLSTGLSEGFYHRLHFHAPGYQSYYSAPIYARAGTALDLGILRFPARRSHIVYARSRYTGGPLSDATAYLVPSHQAAAGPNDPRHYATSDQAVFYATPWCVATTDATGLALLSAERSENLILVVARRGYAPYVQELGADSAEHTCELSIGGSVVIDVLRAGMPVEGILFRPLDMSGTLGSEVLQQTPYRISGQITDGQGRAVFEGLGPGRYRFENRSPINRFVEVDIALGQVVERTIDL